MYGPGFPGPVARCPAPPGFSEWDEEESSKEPSPLLQPPERPRHAWTSIDK
jgi:hypothetical protein